MSEAEIISPLHKMQSKFCRFTCVGTLNTLFGYSVFSLFVYLGFYHSSAVIISTMISILFNYKTIGNFVFKDCNNKPILKFLLVSALIAVLNILLLDVEVKLKINVYIAGAILLLPLGLLSFILNNKLVFTESYEKN